LASIYTVRFAAARAVSGGFSVGPVPPGQTWVIRDIDVFAGSEPLGSVGQVLGAEGQCFMFWNTDPLTQTLVSWRGRHVLSAGESFSVSISTGNADLTISGYELGP
jgi:hypothetical protein